MIRCSFLFTFSFKQVLISHSSGDLDIAEKVYCYLQDKGISCWIDSKNITGAYARSIIEGIKESELMVLIFSNKVNESMHVENEVDNAFCMKKAIIPFRIEAAPYSDVLRYYLSKAHYVDAYKDFENALAELCTQIRRNLPEQQNLEKLENALQLLSAQYGVNIDTLKTLFDEFQKQKQGVDNFDRLLTNFINSNFSEITEEGLKKGEAEVNHSANDENVEEDTQEEVANSDGNGKYDILQNAAGEILILINWKKSEPKNPRFVFDGGFSALLYRNKESAIMLDNIGSKAREAIMEVDEILIVEILDDDVAREYKVPVRKIKSLDQFL